MPLLTQASTEPTMLDPVSQRRLVDLSAQLRCLVCQNQSIAESNAELAVDLRNQINEQIKLGRSDTEIVDFMVTRYGDFVLYRPPFKATTALLWIGPIALLLLAVLVFYRTLVSRRARVDERPLTDAERAEAQRMLASTAQNKNPS
jgi:cytochrome c-type biogenesis protein CcmH